MAVNGNLYDPAVFSAWNRGSEWCEICVLSASEGIFRYLSIHNIFIRVHDMGTDDLNLHLTPCLEHKILSAGSCP